MYIYILGVVLNTTGKLWARNGATQSLRPRYRFHPILIHSFGRGAQSPSPKILWVPCIIIGLAPKPQLHGVGYPVDSWGPHRDT